LSLASPFIFSCYSSLALTANSSAGTVFSSEV
jgi:hypothetical protein